jgi:hypothetical protein
VSPIVDLSGLVDTTAAGLPAGAPVDGAEAAPCRIFTEM